MTSGARHRAFHDSSPGPSVPPAPPPGSRCRSRSFASTRGCRSRATRPSPGSSAAAILILAGLVAAMYSSRREALGPRRARGCRVGRHGSGVRVAAEGSVRRGLPEDRRGSGRRAIAKIPAERREEVGGAVSTADWARVSSDAFNAALFAYIAAMVLSFAYLAFRRTSFHTAALVVGTVGLVRERPVDRRRGDRRRPHPWGNMYEYSALLTFLIVLAYLVIVEWRYHVTTLGGFIYAFAIFTMAMAVSFFYVGPTDLLPALNSYWRQIHVTAMITASSLLGSAACSRSSIWSRWRRSAAGSRRSAAATRRPSSAVPSTPTSTCRRTTCRGADEPVGSPRRRAGAADRPAALGHAGPARVPLHPVRVPDLDLRRRSAARSGRSRRGAATGAGIRRRRGRSSRGRSSPGTCTPGRRQDGRARSAASMRARRVRAVC